MTVGCLVAAGQSPNRPDRLAASVGQPCKALVSLEGKPMLEYTLDAVQQAQQIGPVAVIGPQILEPLAARYGATWLPQQGGVLDNGLAGCHYLFEQHPGVDRVVICMADTPFLAAEHLDWFVDTCAATEHDFYWAVVPKKLMLQAFPTSRRTYTRIRDGAICSGNLLLLARKGLESFHTHSSEWDWVFRNRKQVWLVPLKLGLWPSLRFLSGRMSAAEVEAMVQRAFGVRVHAVFSPYADHGMDVDKPFQLEIATQELVARRQAGAAR
jgi:molybdopterin-guanine dinucleotide biosynthesis protein A